MDCATMDRTLDLMTPGEVRLALWFVDVCERAGTMMTAEADDWRQRILARQRFLEMDGTEASDVQAELPSRHSVVLGDNLPTVREEKR